MKKTIICNIPMKARIDKSVYISEDKSIPASGRKVSFPVNAFIEAAITEGAELKVILLAKDDEFSSAEANILCVNGFFSPAAFATSSLARFSSSRRTISFWASSSPRWVYVFMVTPMSE